MGCDLRVVQGRGEELRTPETDPEPPYLGRFPRRLRAKGGIPWEWS